MIITTPRTLTQARTDIGIFVHQLRQLLGLTQAQFAMQLKVAVPTVAPLCGRKEKDA
ncbi:hypothetical protein [Nostoc sp.]|uniref:hypothetical protein n=1 Tax=Nostoc sp. TaxID=1180 RepID=UPI002FFA5762